MIRLRRSVLTGAALLGGVSAGACDTTSPAPACTRPGEPARIEIKVDTLDGRVVVTNAVRPSGGHLRPIDAVVLARFRADSLVASAAQIGVDARGNVFVVEPRRSHIIAFDADGQVERVIPFERFGPAGAGLVGVTAEDHGSLTVRTPGALARLGPDGELIDRRESTLKANYHPYVGYRGADGNLYELSTSLGPAAGDEREYRSLLVRTRLDASGTTDTVNAVSIQWQLVPGTPIPPPLFDRLVVAVDRRQGLYFAASRSYRIQHVSASGDTTLTFSLTATPVPVDSAARRRKAAAWSSETPIDPIHVPVTEPVIEAIVADESGTVVVFPNIQGAQIGEIADVFRDGRHHVRVRFTPLIELQHRAPVLFSDTLYAAARTPHGSAEVLTYRLPILAER